MSEEELNSSSFWLVYSGKENALYIKQDQKELYALTRNV
ncbi:hypothetical protein M7I_4194 [Glarea lozoyensis 74030]|uniref:Uncharacterized protein n=1 Tax=Glarea lozoyensis (strain ATCC 74030 / MF5533) TaxID=1104152 RepID=H0ENI9_GLAL7|nr:hypothetical protein M7I_4194 [Glarea lozoyensis 74030]